MLASWSRSVGLSAGEQWSGCQIRSENTTEGRGFLSGISLGWPLLTPETILSVYLRDHFICEGLRGSLPLVISHWIASACCSVNCGIMLGGMLRFQRCFQE